MTPDTEHSISELGERRLRLIDRLLALPEGLAWCEEHTSLVDAVVVAVADELGTALRQVAIVAVGGYGRRELSPYSDVDLTLIPSDENAPVLDEAVRAFFRDLHHALGTILRLEVGYAYRLISDAPGLDAKTRTGLMDARLIAGAPGLLRALQDGLEESLAPGEFILEKVEERGRMLAKTNDTPLVVEPHLKEGAGGLRCFHCSNWIRVAIGERESRPDASYDAVVRMRNLLHATTGKRADELTRSRQAPIAEALNTDPMAMMGRHAEHAVAVHARYIGSLETIREARFRLSRGCLAIAGEARWLAGADLGDAAVGVAVATRLGLRVSDLSPASSGEVNGASAAFALTQGERTIRNIDRAGLLDPLLPELAACRTAMPQDTIHEFTVFEHSIRVVRAVERLPSDSFLGRLRDGLHDAEALYLAALLHDVAKPISEPDHAELGSVVARRIAESWGLSPRIAEAVEWLVAHHLVVSHTMRFRDPAEPATARELADLAGELDRLNMLCLLTYADVSAIGTDIWTPSQQILLEELHGRAAALLTDAESPSPGVHRARLRRELSAAPASPAEIEDFVSGLPAHYLNSMSFDQVRLHMAMVQRARQGEPILDLTSRPEIGASDLTVCCRDTPGLLNQILGAVYAHDLRVQSIRACTTGDSIAVDAFSINLNGRPVPAATASELLTSLGRILSRETTVEEVLHAHGKDPNLDQRVLSYRYIEGTPGILEVRAPRARGLPYRLARLVAQRGWNIHSARLGQWADNASAALYLTKGDGSELYGAEVESAMAPRPTP